MFPINRNEISKYVENNISTFHSKRLISLENLSLNKVLVRKNPYLYKAKNVLTANDIVKGILDAHLSSQEETIFGEFLEGLAIFINEKTFKGNKSSAEGIDLEFDREEVKYIVSIKSGPNWGNSQQIVKMKEDFRKAKRILNTNTSKKKIIAVNGCCYGKDNKPDKSEYLKLCGQRFWEFVSGKKELYTDLIEPLGHRAKEKNEEFLVAYSRIINKFTFEFGKEFCEESGKINWEKLVKFNSAS